MLQFPQSTLSSWCVPERSSAQVESSFLRYKGQVPKMGARRELLWSGVESVSCVSSPMHGTPLPRVLELQWSPNVGGPYPSVKSSTLERSTQRHCRLCDNSFVYLCASWLLHRGFDDWAAEGLFSPSNELQLLPRDTNTNNKRVVMNSSDRGTTCIKFVSMS